MLGQISRSHLDLSICIHTLLQLLQYDWLIRFAITKRWTGVPIEAAGVYRITLKIDGKLQSQAHSQSVQCNLHASCKCLNAPQHFQYYRVCVSQVHYSWHLLKNIPNLAKNWQILQIKTHFSVFNVSLYTMFFIFYTNSNSSLSYPKSKYH